MKEETVEMSEGWENLLKMLHGDKERSVHERWMQLRHESTQNANSIRFCQRVLEVAGKENKRYLAGYVLSYARLTKTNKQTNKTITYRLVITMIRHIIKVHQKCTSCWRQDYQVDWWQWQLDCHCCLSKEMTAVTIPNRHYEEERENKTDQHKK